MLSKTGEVRVLISGGIEGGDGIGFDMSQRFLYVSSITKGEIYKIDIADKSFEVIYKGLTTPADISVDARYNRILVPLMQRGAVMGLRLK